MPAFFVVKDGGTRPMQELFCALSGVFAAGGGITVTQTDPGTVTFSTGADAPKSDPLLTADPISGQPLPAINPS